MKAIITQRQGINQYGLPVDTLEATYISYFEDLGLDLTIISNYTKRLDQKLKGKIDLIILTGGGSINPIYYEEGHKESLQEKRDLIEEELISHGLKESIPILAICRGMQYMNGLMGGKISRLNKLNIPRPIGKDHEILLGEKTISVNNYHNDGIYINDLGKNLTIIGLDKANDIVEAFYSMKNKILGLQWHPERNFSCKISKDENDKLIREFILTGGKIDEGYYISSR